MKTEKGKKMIWCAVRKKYVTLLPEEKVRQQFIQYLHHAKNFPIQLMKVEMAVKFALLRQRLDIVLFNRNAQPIIIVECKAPHVTISQQAFEQLSRYNYHLQVPCLAVTNGITHYCYKIDFGSGHIEFIKEIPAYKKCV